jgi:lipid A 3-O-deacylase
MAIYKIKDRGLITIKQRRHNTVFLNTILTVTVWLACCAAARGAEGEGGASIVEQSAEAIGGLSEALVNLLPKLPRHSSFTVYWENDGTFVKPNHRTDRHYTDGLKLVFTHQPEWMWLKEFATWNDFGAGEGDVDTAVGYTFGQNMYTPDHADDPSLRDADDRVFAAWLYGGIFVQRATKNEMEHFELSVGTIGPSALGGEVQTFVHKLVNQEEPNGWDDQLDDEFAVDFTWLKRQRADGLPFYHTPSFDSYLEYGFTAGSLHRNAILGIMLRLGENLPSDFGPGRLEAPHCVTGPIGDKQTYFYLFGRASVKVVQYDRFLTGLDTRPVVGQFQLGAVFRYESFEITYSQTFLTCEYYEQPAEDSYASLNLSYRF